MLFFNRKGRKDNNKVLKARLGYTFGKKLNNSLTFFLVCEAFQVLGKYHSVPKIQNPNFFFAPLAVKK